jgi:GT2 family glycosyltransferase
MLPTTIRGWQVKAVTNVSVVVVTSKRREYLEKCLKSVFATQDGPDEVYVVVNGGDMGTCEYLAALECGHSALRHASVAKTGFGGSRNVGVRRVRGDYIVFLDDDIETPSEYFTVLRDRIAKHPGCDVFGGPNLTPPGSSLMQRCFGYVLETWFGAASMRRRYVRCGGDADADERSLILCNLAIRAAVFERGFTFNEDVSSNEENLLLQELAEKGFRIMYAPDLYVYHHRREDVPGFCAQIFKYGRGRADNMLHRPKTASAIFFAPTAALTLAIITLLAYRTAFLFLAAAYAALDASSSIWKAARERDAGALFWLLVLYPLEHISYGAGFAYQMTFGCRRR